VSRLVEFFTALIERDPGGRSWLPDLLRAAPRGTQLLGPVAEEPGYLSISQAVRGASGRLACFDHPVSPPRELLDWYVEHPERLTWPPEAQLTPETEVLRRALILDQPAGARSRAQDRARELATTRSVLSREWWRFEELYRLQCVLMTDRLVLTVEAASEAGLAPVTAWYPQRNRVVRNLEAARTLASEGRRWASLILSESPIPQAAPDAVADSLPAAAPHLDDDGRRELLDAYLGNLVWARALAAVAGSPSPAPSA
jgi:hypothetical protein